MAFIYLEKWKISSLMAYCNLVKFNFKLILDGLFLTGMVEIYIYHKRGLILWQLGQMKGNCWNTDAILKPKITVQIPQTKRHIINIFQR